MKKYKLKRTVTVNSNDLYRGSFVYQYVGIHDHGAAAKDAKEFAGSYISVTKTPDDFSASFSVPLEALSFVCNEEELTNQPTEYAMSYYGYGVLMPTPKAQPSPAYAAPAPQAPVMPTAAPAPAPVPMAPVAEWHQGTPPPAPEPARAPAQVPSLRDESPAPTPEPYTVKLYLTADIWPHKMGDCFLVRHSDWMRIREVTGVNGRFESSPHNVVDYLSTCYLSERKDVERVQKPQAPTLRDYQVAPTAPIPASQLIRETFADTSVGTDYKGHETLAHMVHGHISTWLNGLNALRTISSAGMAEDAASYWEHEIKALEEIKLAVMADIQDYNTAKAKQTLNNEAKADAERCVRDAVNTLNSALVHMSYV
jgi:hypothetical protein